jgi:sugar phosphate isomerase/epimerase
MGVSTNPKRARTVHVFVNTLGAFQQKLVVFSVSFSYNSNRDQEGEEMRFGVCAPIEMARAVLAAGADYIELNCSATLQPDLGESDWAPMRDRLSALPLPVEAFNVLMTAGKLVGPDADLLRLAKYVDRAARRAAELGASIIVIGSGGARAVPPEVSQYRATAQFKAFLEACALAGERHGVKFCIEPLNRRETNLINSVAAGADLVRHVHSSYVRLLVDSYHMEVEREPLDAIIKSHGLISHAHTADANRVPPGQSYYDHSALRNALRFGGYRDRISIECNWQDFESEVGPAVEHLRATMA